MNSDDMVPTSLPNTTITTTESLSLIPEDTFQFLETTTTAATDPLSQINPTTSMINSMNNHSFYQHLLSQQQLQQLQLQQQQHDMTTISHPRQNPLLYNERRLNMTEQHYDMGLPTSTSPLSSNGGGNRHTPLLTNSANSTPPLPQEIINPQDLPTTSFNSITNSISCPVSTAASILDTNRNLYQHQQQNSHIPKTTTSTDRQQNPIYVSSPQASHDGNIDNNRQPHQQTRDNSNFIVNDQRQNPYHQLQQLTTSNMVGPQGLNIISPATNTPPSSSPLPTYQQRLQNSTKQSNQSSSPDHSATLDSNNSITTQSNGKRLNQDTSTTTETLTNIKKAKHDTSHHQQQQTSTPIYFTADSFQQMTREQLISRLVVLENEQIDRLRQTGQSSRKEMSLDDKNSSSSSTTTTTKVNHTSTVSPSPINTHTSDDEIQGKNSNNGNNKIGDDDEDDEDDDDEESESISSVTDSNLNDTSNNDNTEMRCLWKNCGMACIGVQGLTGHIVRTHVGGGKPLYYCEWENCRRIQKPFTKRHKIRNHLRIHTGERPFVCEKPGCEKRFSRPDSLVTHAKTHCTVRPFTCHIPGCEKAYYHIRSLRKHLKLHEEERGYEYGGGPLDTNNFNMNLATTATVGATSHPHQHPYSFAEQLSIQPFILQASANLDTTSIHNKQMIDPSLMDPAHSLFDPLAFHALTSLQTPQPPQYMHLNPTSIPPTSMTGTSGSLTMINPPSVTTIQQNQQQ